MPRVVTDRKPSISLILILAVIRMNITIMQKFYAICESSNILDKTFWFITTTHWNITYSSSWLVAEETGALDVPPIAVLTQQRPALIIIAPNLWAWEKNCIRSTSFIKNGLQIARPTLGRPNQNLI
jgi:hypothetical protein